MAKNTLPGSKAPKPQQESKNNVGRPKLEKFKCSSCGVEYTRQDGFFFTSSSELFAANNGFVPICKTCLEKHYTEKLLPAMDGDEYHAMETFCAICDWYYVDDAVDMAAKALDTRGSHGALCTEYAGRRALRQFQKYGKTYMDNIIQRRDRLRRVQEANEAIPEDNSMFGPKKSPGANGRYAKAKAAANQEAVHMFGLGYTPEEYTYLLEQYNDWINRYDCQTKAQEELFKSLCIAQLNIRLAQEARDAKAAAEAMKAFQNLLDTAKIMPKQEKGDHLTETNTFGTLIKKWEDEHPIPKPAPEWEDVDGIRKYINTWFLGHLCKMFRVENDVTAEYEEELGKYTVETPAFQFDDEEDVSDEFSDVIGSAKLGEF